VNEEASSAAFPGADDWFGVMDSIAKTRDSGFTNQSAIFFGILLRAWIAMGSRVGGCMENAFAAEWSSFP
jgi:hypothetical protein